MTHDFIRTSLYCRFERLLSENVIKTNRSQYFVKKLTQYGSMVDVYIKAKILVYRRLNFRATVHKMSDFCFFTLKC